MDDVPAELSKRISRRQFLFRGNQGEVGVLPLVVGLGAAGMAVVGWASPQGLPKPLGSSGQYIRSNGSIADWAQILHSELGSVTADQHHARLHALSDALDHSGFRVGRVTGTISATVARVLIQATISPALEDATLSNYSVFATSETLNSWAFAQIFSTTIVRVFIERNWSVTTNTITLPATDTAALNPVDPASQNPHAHSASDAGGSDHSHGMSGSGHSHSLVYGGALAVIGHWLIIHR